MTVSMLICIAIIFAVKLVTDALIKLGYGNRKVPAVLVGLFIGAVIGLLLSCFIEIFKAIKTQ